MKNWLVVALVCAGFLGKSQSFNESFESGALPAGWQNVAIGTEVWSFLDSALADKPEVSDLDGTKRAVFPCGNAGESAYLATKTFDLSGNFSGQAVVNFGFVRNTALNEQALLSDNLSIYVDSTDITDGIGQTLLGTINRHKLYYPADTTLGKGWIRFSYPIPADYGGTNNRIVFQSLSSGGHNLMIDDVNVIIPTSTAYCTPVVDSACANIASFFISETLLDGMSIQASGSAECGTGGYTDYSNLFIASLLQQGTAYTLTANTASDGTAPTPAEGKLFVDWNQDGDFDDVAEELIGVPSGANFDFTVVVPVDALSGNTRARFMVHGLGSINDDPSACGTVEYGEYEDYTLRIGEDPITAPSCPTSHSPIDGKDGLCERNPTFSWTAAGAPSVPSAGFNFWLGELDGSDNVTWIFSGLDLGDTNQYQLIDTLKLDTRYAWKAVPYNAIGETATCDSLVFTTNKAGSPEIGLADTLTVCKDQDLLINPSVLGGTPFLSNDSMTFTWSGDSTQFLDRLDTISTTFSGGGVENFIYLFEVVDSLGCSDVDSVVVQVKPKATAGLAAADQLVCAGDSADLTLRNFVGTIQWQDSIDGALWDNVTTGLGSVSADYTTGSINVTNYFRAIVELNGCMDTSNMVTVGEIQVPAGPMGATIGADSTLCPEDSVLLGTTDFPGPGLVWMLNGDTLAVDTNQYMAIGGGDYVLFYLKTVGAVSCPTDADTIPITNSSNPSVPLIELNNGDSICEGDSTIARVVNYIDEDASLEWTGGTFTDSLLIQTNFAGVVVYTDALDCKRTSDSVIVSFFSIPEQPIVDVVGDVPPCEGDSLLLVVTNHNEGVTWDDANNTEHDTLVVKNDGTYTATVVTGPNCSSTSSGSVIQFNPRPDQPIITVFGDSLLVDSTTVHRWYKDGVLLPADSTFYIEGASSGTYTVVSINEFGCESEVSEPFSYVGIRQNAKLSGQFGLYPNPGSTTIWIDGWNEGETGEVKVTDLNGKQTILEVSEKGAINVRNLNRGVYIFSIYGQQVKWVK